MSTKEIFEIFADEAWTHNTPPLRRYWCFLGGVFGSKGNLDRLDKVLKKVKVDCAYGTEAKWTKLTAASLECYKRLVDCFAAFVERGEIKYRQMFLDRSYVHYETYQQSPHDLYSLGVQFKLYYQFIKHHFGIEHMPRYPHGALIYLRLDDHSSQKHKQNLETFVKDLPRILKRPDLKFEVSYINSARVDRVQICDLLMGAAGSHGNRMQDIRVGGRRGMTAKQKVRAQFCKHVYDHLRRISCSERGSAAFNWFENTGVVTPSERFTQKIRIWKFVPKTYLKDKGWENDHLGPEGNYVKSDIDFGNVHGLSGPDLDF